MPKVTIIVPCYNASKYLRRCMDSLINQTLKDIEIIAINDGSTDDTLDILQEYAYTDKRVILIDKVNEGWGVAMNLGIASAQGEYIGEVDADDWVDADCYEKLYQMAQGCDVVKAGFVEEYGLDEFRAPIFKPRLVTDEVCAGIPINLRLLTDLNVINQFYCFQGSVWSAIYRKEFLDRHNIRCTETKGASYQDISFTFKVWSWSENVKLMDECFYHYNLSNADASVKDQSKIYCVVDEMNEILAFCETYKNVLPSWIEVIRTRVMFGNYIWNYFRLEVRGDRLDFLQVFREQMIRDLKYVNDNLYTTKELALMDMVLKSTKHGSKRRYQ